MLRVEIEGSLVLDSLEVLVCVHEQDTLSSACISTSLTQEDDKMSGHD